MSEATAKENKNTTLSRHIENTIKLSNHLKEIYSIFKGAINHSRKLRSMILVDENPIWNI